MSRKRNFRDGAHLQRFSVPLLPVVVVVVLPPRTLSSFSSSSPASSSTGALSSFGPSHSLTLLLAPFDVGWPSFPFLFLIHVRRTHSPPPLRNLPRKPFPTARPPRTPTHRKQSRIFGSAFSACFDVYGERWHRARSRRTRVGRRSIVLHSPYAQWVNVQECRRASQLECEQGIQSESKRLRRDGQRRGADGEALDAFRLRRPPFKRLCPAACQEPHTAQPPRAFLCLHYTLRLRPTFL